MNIAFAGLVGAAGTTTTWHAAGLRWPSPRTLMIEADPDGGRIAARTGLSLDSDAASLVSLVGAIRHSVDDETVWRNTQTLAESLPVVVAPASPPVAERAVGLLAAKWHDLTAAVGDGTDVLVDIGRLRPGTPAQRIAAGCDRCVVVARPRLDDLTVLFAGLDDLADSVRLCIVVRGTAGYPLAEITNAIASRRPDVLVAGVLADDPRAAATLDGTATMTPRRLDRSPLMRSVDTLRTALGAGFEEGVWA